MSVHGCTNSHINLYHQFQVENKPTQLVEVTEDQFTFEEDDLFLLEMDRWGAAAVEEGEELVATKGVGPCIAIIAYGWSKSGKRINALYHWSGPSPNEPARASAIDAIEKLISSLEVYKVTKESIQVICLGGQEMSRRNQDALNDLRRDYPIISEVINFPYESQTGWDIVLEGTTIYYGVEIIVNSQ